MKPYGSILGITFCEVVPLENTGKSVFTGERQHVSELHFAEPLAVIDDTGLFGVEYLCNLFKIALSIGSCLFERKRYAGFAASGGISYHCGKIADDKYDLMSEILQHPQLSQNNGMPEMEIGTTRVGAHFYNELFTALKLFKQPFL